MVVLTVAVCQGSAKLEANGRCDVAVRWLGISLSVRNTKRVTLFIVLVRKLQPQNISEVAAMTTNGN